VPGRADAATGARPRVAPQPLGPGALRSGLLRRADLIAAVLEETALSVTYCSGDVQARRSRPSAPWSRCGARASSSRPAAGSRRGASPPGHRRRPSRRPLALKHEPEGRCCVCRCSGRVLPWHQELDRRPQRPAWRTGGRSGPGWRARSRGARRRGPTGTSSPAPPPRSARAGCPIATRWRQRLRPRVAAASGPLISVHSGTSSSCSKPRYRFLKRRRHGRLVSPPPPAFR